MRKILIKDVAIFYPFLAAKGYVIQKQEGDVLIVGDRFAKIGGTIKTKGKVLEINGRGMWLVPGLIDDQVHFRDNGAWRYKSNFYQETRAAIMGGVTSFMDMHNIQPPTLSYEMLEAKYKYASNVSLANYSFYMGVANDNEKEVMKVVARGKNNVCGLKMFLGSSTGNLLLDDQRVIEKIMKRSDGMLIAVHCEDEATIRANKAMLEKEIRPHAADHPLIRNTIACYISSSRAVALAKKTGARLHVFHLSTGDEVVLFDNTTLLKDKKITSEVCVHHLFFSSKDYEKYGNQIVCNPAIKDESDRQALLHGVWYDHIDVIATDHAAHALWEKNLPYWDIPNMKQQTPSGIPTIQHSFNMMHELHLRDELNINIQLAIQKMTIDVATCFKIVDRGAIAEGYFADCFLFDPRERWEVRNKELSDPKGDVETTGGWSPFHGQYFSGKNMMTIVNGHIAYKDGIILEGQMGRRLEFNR